MPKTVSLEQLSKDFQEQFHKAVRQETRHALELALESLETGALQPKEPPKKIPLVKADDLRGRKRRYALFLFLKDNNDNLPLGVELVVEGLTDCGVDLGEEGHEYANIESMASRNKWFTFDEKKESVNLAPGWELVRDPHLIRKPRVAKEEKKPTAKSPSRSELKDSGL